MIIIGHTYLMRKIILIRIWFSFLLPADIEIKSKHCVLSSFHSCTYYHLTAATSHYEQITLNVYLRNKNEANVPGEISVKSCWVLKKSLSFSFFLPGDGNRKINEP